jgi:hypothetical protein
MGRGGVDRDATGDPTEVPRRRMSRWWLLLGIPAALAAVAAAFVPKRLGTGLCSPSTAAIATLRNLAAVQAQFQARGCVDVDGDATGEFGTLLELTGKAPPRSAPDTSPLSPPILSPSLAGVTSDGWVEKAHYAFAVLLPRKGGGWIRETGGTPPRAASGSAGCAGSGNAAPGSGGVAATGEVDTDLAETEWCAIAWPRMYGDRTTRMFFVTAQGDVLQSDNPRRLACDGPLPCGPADVLPPGWKPGDRIPGGYVARDGATWRVTN